MIPVSAGQVRSGSEGCVHVTINGQAHFICPEDLGMLLFIGESVPLLAKRPGANENPMVSGRVRLNPSGRSVIIESGRERFMVPRDRFLAVAFGEDISTLIFEIPSDRAELEIISPCKGGTA